MKRSQPLIVVDVQNGFISKETKHVVPRIQQLLNNDIFSTVLFTRFINEENSPFRTILDWYSLTTKEEQGLVNEIIPYTEGQMVIDKTGYTCINSETLQFLKSNNSKEVFLLGIDTDSCVLKTAVDLFENDFKPIVLEYYSASNGGELSHNAGITVLERFIGKENIITHPIS